MNKDILENKGVENSPEIVEKAYARTHMRIFFLLPALVALLLASKVWFSAQKPLTGVKLTLTEINPVARP